MFFPAVIQDPGNQVHTSH